MQGFGIQTKNIDELIRKIEQEIAFITKNIDKSIVVLNNKLEYCSGELNKLKEEFIELKTYTETEYNKLQQKFESLLEEVELLKENCIKVEFNDSTFGERVASGIAPLEEYEITHKAHPIYAKYADNDGLGNNISETYVNVNETLSSTSAIYLPENKEKLAQAQALTGMMKVNKEKHQLILGF